MSGGNAKAGSSKHKRSVAWVMSAIVLAGIVGVVLWKGTQVSAPLPPVVNTQGFDPIIAKAIAEARETAVATPGSAESRGRMGMVLLAHDVRAPASECFAQASLLAPREARWPHLRGLSQMVDNPMGAATNFARAVRLFPETESVPRLRLGDVLLGLGRFEEAEAQYRAVLKREPNSAAAKLGLGKIANSRSRPAEAAELLAAAAQDPSTRKAAHRLLINLNQRLRKTNEIALLEQKLAELPNDTPLQDRWLAEVQQLKTGEAAWTERADDWIKEGRIREAVPLLENTLQVYPNSDRAMFLLGRARSRLGDAAGAEAILQRAIEIAPGSIEAQMQLGVIRLRRGRPKEAQPCFRAAIQAKPNLGEAWYNLGLSLGQELGKRSESMAAFREAIRLKPNMAEAYLGLAVVLRAEGQKAAAADELRLALALKPEEPMRKNLLEQLKQLEQ